MALFNFRRVGSVPAAAAGPSAQPESVETMRKRARHRLIGAVVLVLAGVIGFPLLFDTQPRPIEVDIPIQIPGKNSVKPLALPEPAQTGAVQNALPVAAAPGEKVATAASLAPEEEIVSSKPAKPARAEKPEIKPPPEAARNEVKPAPKPKPEPKPEPKAEARPAHTPAPAPAPKIDHTPAPPKPVVKAEAKPEPKPEPKPVAKVERPINGSADSVRAMALLNGQAAPLHSAPQAESGGRVVVQVGAFADGAKAQEIRAKLEGAGLKAFTQVVDVKDGKRTRVRVGPFASKAEADQAAAKIRQLGLSAAILSY